MATLLVIIYIVFISLGLPDSLFGVSWPVVHEEFCLPERFASVYSIIIALCTGGVSFFAGKMIRKFGTGKVTFFSTLLTAVGLVGISISPNIWVMMVFSVILGYGAGAIDTGLNNYVSLHYEAKHMNWLHCFWGLGVTVSPIIMSVFLDGQSGNWRNGYRVIALVQFAIAMIVLATLRKWHPDSADHTNPENQAPDKSFRELIRQKGVRTSILSLGLYFAGESILGTWGATYAVNVFQCSPDAAAKWVSLYYGGIMLGRIVSGFASSKVSDDWLVKSGSIAAALGVILLLLPIGTLALGGLLLIGFGFGPIFPSVIHSVPSRFGTDYSADLTGFHMGGSYMLGYPLQLIFGFIAASTSFSIMPYVLLLLCGAVLITNTITLNELKKHCV